MAFSRHQIVAVVVLSLVHAACSRIETGFDLPQDRRFEPELVTKASRANLAEQSHLQDPQGGLSRQTVSNSNPNRAISKDLAITRSGAAAHSLTQIAPPPDRGPGATADDPFAAAPEADLDRYSSDRVMVVVEFPLPLESNREETNSRASGPGDLGAQQPELVGLAPGLGTLERASDRNIEARLSPAAGSEPDLTRGEDRTHLARAPTDYAVVQDPVEIRNIPMDPSIASVPVRTRQSQALLSGQIRFAGDRYQLSSADQDQLKELSKRLQTTERRVHVRSLVDASTRAASQARRLALKRLFVVRDFLVDQGLSKRVMILDAVPSVIRAGNHERVEIAAIPSRDPKPAAASSKRSSTSEGRFRTQFAAVWKQASPTTEGLPSEHSGPRGGISDQSSTGSQRASDSGAQKQSVPPDRVIHVQVGSHKHRKDALKDADRLKRRFRELLNGHEFWITSVDLEGRGRFHRVRTGPFPDKTEASALCGDLRQQGQDCLVVSSREWPAAQ